MPSLVIRLDPAKLARATADVRYEIPARLAARSHGLIQEDGYDYEPGDAMQIYLRTSDLARALPMVVALLENERFDGELLTPAAEVGVSDVEAIDTKAFRVVFPAAATGFIVPWRPPTLAERALVEELYGFRFPPAFHALVDRPPEALRRLFPRGRFTTVAEARSFQGDRPRLVPFFVEPQPAHQDIYCFDLETPGPGVTVFAIHTTVAAWENLAAWLAWVEERAPRD